MSRRTPISDLLGRTLPPNAQPPVAASPRNRGGLGGWVIVALLCVILWMLYQQYRPSPTPTPPDDDKREQVEPQPPALVGKTLIFIHERDPQPIEHDLLLREMPKFTAERKLQFRVFDDDDTTQPIPQVIAFAKTKGIDPPFVVLTDKDDRPKSVIAWPAGIEGLEKLR